MAARHAAVRQPARGGTVGPECRQIIYEDTRVAKGWGLAMVLEMGQKSNAHPVQAIFVQCLYRFCVD